MELFARRNGRREDPSMSARSRFGRYKKEPQKSRRETQIEPRKELQELLDTWSEYQPRLGELFDGENWDNPAPFIEFTIRHLEGIDPAPETVERFSLLLDDIGPVSNALQGDMGVFLGALISSGSSSEYPLRTASVGWLPENLGLYTDKRLIIDGDIGIELGWMMSSGEIIVRGDACDGIGHDMRGGRIIVEGDVRIRQSDYDGYGLGQRMRGGEIILKGDLRVHAEVLDKIKGELESNEAISLRGRLIVER